MYLAGREAGWHELRTASTAEDCRIVKRKFGDTYQWLTNKVCQGEALEGPLAIEHCDDPSIYSNQLILNSAVELHKTVKTVARLAAAHLTLLTHWVKHQILLNPFAPRATANIQFSTAEFRLIQETMAEQGIDPLDGKSAHQR